MAGAIRTAVLAICAAAVTACWGPPDAAGSQATTSAGASSTPAAGAAPASAPARGTLNAGPAGAYLGGPKRNAILEAGITQAGFFPSGRPAPPGLRYYTVGLRGTSRSDSAALMGASKGDDVLIDVNRFVYAQNERGCIARPARGVTELTNPIGESITFPPKGHAEGQLAFLVPHDTTRVRLLIAPAGGDGLIIPVGEDFTPAWPTPLESIEDGGTMRVHVLPSPPVPAGVPAPQPGREHLLLDVAIENLNRDQGIEFQTSQQLRLIGANGSFIQLSASATAQLGCRVDDGDVIPPGHVRRAMAIFELPASTPPRLHFRGFEKDEAVVNLRRVQ